MKTVRQYLAEQMSKEDCLSGDSIVREKMGPFVLEIKPYKGDLRPAWDAGYDIVVTDGNAFRMGWIGEITQESVDIFVRDAMRGFVSHYDSMSSPDEDGGAA